MTKSREFIQKGLMGATGVAIGGIGGLTLDTLATPAINRGYLLPHRLLHPEIEAEEVVYRYEPANNGAGPMWCSGSACLVRIGKRVFASGLKTVAGWKPLNNCRWMLFERLPGGWKQIMTDPDGPARPEILLFDSKVSMLKHEMLLQGWAGTPPFTEHSYRTLAADGAAEEMILFQNIGYTHAEWSFRDPAGKWSAQGQLVWPWGAEYEEQEPVRVHHHPEYLICWALMKTKRMLSIMPACA
jgi:hypothetical protein